MTRSFDVIVVGGGPAGSVMGWILAKQGVKVAILERAPFPREKVCGDFVEPGGLRILDRIGAMPVIEQRERLRIDRNRVYFGPRLTYKGTIRYYANDDGGPGYGLILPRHELDTVLLATARAAGATVFIPAEAQTIRRESGVMHVEVQTGEQAIDLSAPLLVGADGVESRVARSANLRRTHRRHIGVSQRVYVDGVDIDGGEATIWYDEDIAPGYGWMFPMPCGQANVGVGFSSETAHRYGLSVRDVFRTAMERLRIRHPGCTKMRMMSKPIGGVVKTYGGIDRNHFDGGLLIGDAGSFTDPVTGEGITQGMESAVLALPALMEALERGRFETADLARFDDDFRRYFDPAMRYLELSAACMNNRHMSEFWLRISSHGHEEALDDPAFAGIAGAIFGGPSLQPLAATVQIWTRMLERGLQTFNRNDTRGVELNGRFAEDLAAFRKGWTRSSTEDPERHAAWLGDIVLRMIEVQKTLWTRPNPRSAGVFRFVGIEDGPAPASFPIASQEVRDLLADGARRLIATGLDFLSPGKPPAHDAEPRRRWRVKT